MSSKAKSPSPVVAFVQSVWDNSNSGKGHSWQILNGSLQAALHLAISAHYKFEPDDFHELYRRFDGGYWFGTNPDGKGMGVGYYAQAVECSNMSACQSYEAWRQMKPYLFLGKRLAVGYNSEVGLLVIDPKWKEVAPGSLTRFKTDEQLLESLRGYRNNRWWVTGFDAEFIRLASYYSEKNPYGKRDGKPTKLKKLTHAELDEMSKVLRAGMRPVKEKKRKGEK